MSEQKPARKVVIEVPPSVSIPEEEIEKLSAEFQGQLIDSRSERLVVKATPQEKVREVPQLVQAQEAAVAKEQSQTV